jgi:hypothetical protein
MTREDKALLIGLVIGDGSLNVRRDKRWENSFHSQLNFTHSAKQRQYVEWKSKLLQTIFGGKAPKVTDINNNGYPGVRMSKSNKYFRVLKRYLYADNKKTIPLKALNRLTPKALAIWWMDDGCLYEKKRNGKTHAWELYLNTYLTDSENLVIIDYFKNKWDISWKLNRDKGKSRLRCSTVEGRKFLDIVRKHVLEVPCMAYKAKNI